MKKQDWILIGGILLIAATIFLFYLVVQKDGSKVLVMADGIEYGTYSLDEDQMIQINDTNKLEIKDGRADMIWASCPDKQCVHQKSISRLGESIICLPFKIVVSILDGASSPYDSIAG